jgi:hypothetical protein
VGKQQQAEIIIDFIGNKKRFLAKDAENAKDTAASADMSKSNEIY